MASKNKKEETAAQAAPKPEAQETTAQSVPVAPAPEAPAETEAAPAPAPAPVETAAADKGKEGKKQKPASKSAASVLENVGKSAIARHGFAEVFVTSDGLAFSLRSDAQHHAADLANKDIIKVTRK